MANQQVYHPPINVPKINLAQVDGVGNDDIVVMNQVASTVNNKSKSRTRAQWAPPKREPEDDYLEPGFDPTASVASSFYLPSEQSARSGRSSHRSGGGGGQSGIDRSDGKFAGSFQR